MSDNIAAAIRGAADHARSLLGQLGPLAWALHAMAPPVEALAVCIDRDPGECVQVREGNRRTVVAILEDLRANRGAGSSDLFQSIEYRRTVNHSIVVYAVAILEWFMDEAGEPVWSLARQRGESGPCSCHRPADAWGRSFRTMLKRLEERGCPLGPCAGHAGCRLLAAARNLVTHRGRRDVIDSDFKREADALRLRFLRAPSSESALYAPDGGIGIPCEWVGKVQLSMSIDEFILPRLRDAQTFVGDAANRLAGRAAELSHP